MNTKTHRKRIIERLNQVENEETLNRVEEILIQEQMVARHRESMEDVAAGRVVTIDEFSRKTKQWLKK